MSFAVDICRSAEVDPELILQLREGLEEVFSCPVAEAGSFKLSPEDYHAGRQQYHAPSLLHRLRGRRRDPARLLAVTGADLFAPGLSFVFGEADLAGQCAVISLARLREPYLGFPLTAQRITQRALVEAVHELGHLRGLGHCSRPECVMRFSNTLADTDRKRAEFCPPCHHLLESS